MTKTSQGQMLTSSLQEKQSAKCKKNNNNTICGYLMESWRAILKCLCISGQCVHNLNHETRAADWTMDRNVTWSHASFTLLLSWPFSQEQAVLFSIDSAWVFLRVCKSVFVCACGMRDKLFLSFIKIHLLLRSLSSTFSFVVVLSKHTATLLHF